MKQKKALGMLLAAILLFMGLTPTAASAAPESDACAALRNIIAPSGIFAEGTCGDNLTWTLDSEGTLVISGTGTMQNAGYDSSLWGDYQNDINRVIIEDGVTGIGKLAFYECRSLVSAAIPDSVKSIGESAFDGCESLRSADIPDSVTSMGDYVFCNCSSLESAVIPSGVAKIGIYMFSGCESLVSVAVPDGITSIGESAFSGCKSLTSLVLPDSITSMGEFAFSGCTNLNSVNIPSGVTKIGAYSFYDCKKLASVTVPYGVTGIGDYAFYGCRSLVSAVLPDSVTSIGQWAFRNCDSLTSIRMPAGLNKIGEYAFYGCESLKSVVIPSGVTGIGSNAFKYCWGLGDVTIRGSVTSIGEKTFYYCSSLTSVAIPAGVTRIGDSAFAGCGSLTDVYFGGSSAKWGSIAFGSDNGRLTGANIHYGSSFPAPKNVKAFADTAATMKLTWDAVPGASKYAVYRKEGSADWKLFTTTAATSMTLRTNLKPGYTYRFKIYAKDDTATGAGSDIAVCKFVPPTPTGLTISSTGVGQATIKWDALSGATGYCVYYKRADDSGYTYAGATTATSKTITGLTTGARYAFKIRAYVKATAGVYTGTNVFSEYCKYVSGEIVPAATTGLKIAGTAAGKATISWDAVSGAAAYCIYYKSADDTGYTYFGATTATSKTITGLTTGKRYAFKVRAYAKPTDGPKAGQNVFGPYCRYVSGEIKAN